MSPFGLKFTQMILHTETSKLMYNWSFPFVVLHKPTLLPSTFNQLTLFYECWCNGLLKYVSFHILFVFCFGRFKSLLI